MSDVICLCCQACCDNVFEYGRLTRISSDVKAWPAGGKLAICSTCGWVQTPATMDWIHEIQQIYADYTVYHQSGGEEQAVFDTTTGLPRRRSEMLTDFILEHTSLPVAPKVLDIGCANGQFFRSFIVKQPNAQLFGMDVDKKSLDVLRTIPQFQTLYLPDEQPSEKFDLITLIHTLEHVIDPLILLRKIRNWLNPGGVLFIQVPNSELNPFDLVIADHRLHSTSTTLPILLSHGGFDPYLLSTQVVYKELSCMSRPGNPMDRLQDSDEKHTEGWVQKHVDWLTQVQMDLELMSKKGKFGIFGSSIGAVWCYAHCADQVAFFIDEDPHRKGKSLFSKPILSPIDIPVGMPIYFCMQPALATQICERLQLISPLHAYGVGQVEEQNLLLKNKI